MVSWDILLFATGSSSPSIKSPKTMNREPSFLLQVTGVPREPPKEEANNLPLVPRMTGHQQYFDPLSQLFFSPSCFPKNIRHKLKRKSPHQNMPPQLQTSSIKSQTPTSRNNAAKLFFKIKKPK